MLSAAELSPLSFANILPQSFSPLFALPGEIRNLIWAYTLAPDNDQTRPYPVDSYCRRPDYWAEQTSDVTLLRTCKAIYTEAWHFPWTTSELCFFLAGYEPLGAGHTRYRQNVFLNAIHDSGRQNMNFKHVRIFAKLSNPEDADRLQEILNTPYSEPRTITITIRHHDFDGWTTDGDLYISESWVRKCRFPNSVRTIRVEFESLERKKAQIDEIAEQAVERWEFTREDGRKLSAAFQTEGGVQGEMEVMRWAGESTLDGVRWVRDVGEDNKIWYFVRAVVWRIRDDDHEDEEVSVGLELEDPDSEKDTLLSATDAPGATPAAVDEIIAVPELDMRQISYALRSLEVGEGRCNWRTCDDFSGKDLREMVSVWKQGHTSWLSDPTDGFSSRNATVYNFTSYFDPVYGEYFVPDELWGGIGLPDEPIAVREAEHPEYRNFPELEEEPWPLNRVGRNRKVPKLVW
ncbi:hypothetical protein TWF281_000081 [Arthrobotrys megalospora]